MSGHGAMKVVNLNGVKVYALSGKSSSASWLDVSKERARRKDQDYMRRIELLQDFHFDTASTRLKATPDGKFLIASGIYPPQVKVYELSELSLKFERHLTSEIVEFQILTSDYSKIAFLCADRSICLHAKFGSYFSTRIPRMGRDLLYDGSSCDLVVAASSPDIYRLNLEQGCFLPPLSSRSPGINVLGSSPVHGLLAGGGEDGALECFDPRQKVSVGRIENFGGKFAGQGQEITALRFDERDSMLLAGGTSFGQVVIYDLRSSTPLYVKDHMYSSPIVDIKWHESANTSSRHLVTADTRAVRIWDPQTGRGMTSIEAPFGVINDICVYPGSGLLFMALDSPSISSHFIPALGPAPSWCSFLENITEELEETVETTIYDDYKFVTKGDLEHLNLTNLLGTNLLRAYMHGFFIDYQLYAKAKRLADPFSYELYHQQQVQKKLDADQAARITIKKKLPKVNKELAGRLLAAESKGVIANSDEATVEETRSTGQVGRGLLSDNRFAAMFSEEAFQVDEDAPEFRALHPNAGKSSLTYDHFDLVHENENDEEDEDDMERAHKGVSLDRRRRQAPHAENQGNHRSRSQAGSRKFYKVKDEAHAEAFRRDIPLVTKRLPLEKQVEKVEASNARNRKFARSRDLQTTEITFTPRKSLPSSFGANNRQKSKRVHFK